MKNIILAIFICFCIQLVSISKEVIPHQVFGVSHNEVNISELKQGKLLTFQAIEKDEISDFLHTEEGALITVKIKEYVKPKRGKQNGYLKVDLIKYTIPSRNNCEQEAAAFNIYGTVRMATAQDKKEIVKQAGVAVVGHILKVPGFSQAVAFSKGLINPNPEQTRLQSAGKNLYESTPLTYKEKGNEMTIEQDSIVVMRFRTR